VSRASPALPAQAWRPTLKTTLMTTAGALALAVATALAATPAFAEDIVFDDMAGNTITLTEPAEKVVSIPIPLPPVIATTVGSSDTLVGMHPRAEKSINLGLAHKIWPE